MSVRRNFGNVNICSLAREINTIEIEKLRKSCATAKACGLRYTKFTPVRNWFMIELGLNAGLRVEEMATLKHCDLIIDSDRSSIVVLGKGNKKRFLVCYHFTTRHALDTYRNRYYIVLYYRLIADRSTTP